MFDSGNEAASPSRGYEFLCLRRGRHSILRSARESSSGDLGDAGGLPIKPAWRGIYNEDYAIELYVQEWVGSILREG